MKTRIFWMSLLLCASIHVPAQEFVSDTVYFDFDQDGLRYSSQEALDSLVVAFNDYPSYYIEIFGHTDSIGNDFYNKNLSDRRAKSVLDYLVDKGLDSRRITYEGLGTAKPIASNLTFIGRKKNRRADVSIVYTDLLGLSKLGIDTTTLVTIDSTVVISEDSLTGDRDLSDAKYKEEEEPEGATIDTIYAQYEPFLIKTRNKNVIFGPQGTKIVVDYEAFDTEQEQITFELNELFKREDILLSAMPTTYSNGPLQTSGMVGFAATDRGRIVRLKEEKPARVEMPVVKREEGMNLYVGKGGERGGRRVGITSDRPAFNPVKNWAEDKEVPIAYNSIDKHYTFNLTDLGRVNIARPLYLGEQTSQDDTGFDILVKLKGKRYESRTQVFLIGTNIDTYVPLKKRTKRLYEGTKVRYFSQESELTLVAYQYDNENEPFIAYKTFTLSKELKDSKRMARPGAYFKLKFKKKEMDEFEEIIGDL